MSKMPDVGDIAPNFKSVDQNGKAVKLSDFKGSPVALYFYPEDDTPVCTKQACNLRDNYGMLKDAGVVVLGVSPDDAESHHAFAEKFDLPFTLVADADKTILNAYGIWGEKNMYGNIVMGTKRTTFLIGPDGIILHVFRRPRTAQHAEEIIKKLDALT